METYPHTQSRRPGRRSLLPIWTLPASLVLTALAVPSQTLAQSLAFTDPLTGPISPNLSIPFTKYTYDAQGLKRTQSDNSTDRVMVKTISGAYLNYDFIFEVDVIRTSSISYLLDLIYVGFGQGVPNLGYYNEPSNSFLFRIHHQGGNNGFYHVDAAAPTGTNGANWINNQNFFGSVAQFPNAQKTRFRIERNGDAVTLSVPSQPGSARSFSLAQWAGPMGLNGTNSYLFFGNSVTGTFFSDATLTLAGPPPDTEAPVINSVTPSTATLWPPNHQMVAVSVAVDATDNVGVTSTKIVAVASSEPDNGLGDGDTSVDVEITGPLTVNLRAERSGKGGGRTYSITVEVADAAGNKSYGNCTVLVPKSRGK